MKNDTTIKPITIPEVNFALLPGINEELVSKGIYLRGKVIAESIWGTGNVHIKCGFPPRIVEAKVQWLTESCAWSSDFTTAFSIRNYDNAWVFATDESSSLVSLSTITWDVTKRYYDGFNINISAFSWATKTIYFTCFQ